MVAMQEDYEFEISPEASARRAELMDELIEWADGLGIPTGEEENES